MTSAKKSTFSSAGSDGPVVADALLEQMAAGVSTDNWDIICSYDLVQLNKILKDNYGKADSGIVSALTLTVSTEDPLSGQAMTIIYTVVLAAPELSFSEGINGEVQLSMLMESCSYTVTPAGGVPGPSKIIPANTYTVGVMLPLVALHGDTAAPIPSNTVIDFNPATPSAAHVTLHFTTDPGNAWAVTPNPPAELTDILQNYFITELQSYFQNHVNGIDYTLAGLQNTASAVQRGAPALSASQLVIEPQSFIFATTGTAQNGILSLYIQTVNSGNQPGSPTPSFQPGGNSAFPLPSDYQASLILSRNFVQNVYLLPQLTACGMINLKASVDPISATNAGLTVIGSSSMKARIDSEGIDLGATTELDFETYTLDFSTFPFTFAFSTSTLDISMHAVASSPWSTQVWVDPNPQGAGGGWKDDASGTASATIDLAFSTALKDIISVDQNNFQLKLQVTPTQYTIGINPGGGSCWGDSLQTQVTSHVSTAIGAVVPALTLDFEGINYFATTNLLFPGMQVIQVDTTRKVAIPCDLVLFGNMGTAAPQQGAQQ